MPFTRVDLRDPMVVGRKVYKDGVYLGILRAVGTINKRDGGVLIRLTRPDNPDETYTADVHFQELQIEVTVIGLPDEIPVPDDPKPVSPDTAGYRISGGTASFDKRKAGEEAGASWNIRPGVGDEDETDPDDELKFPNEESAVASDDRVFDRPEGIIRDPDDPKTDIAVVPVGGPLGRSKGMSLDYVKQVLAAAAEACNQSALQAGQVGEQVAEINATITGLKDRLDEARQNLIRASQRLSDHRATVISATQGHGKPAPAVALNQLDQANRKLEEQRVKIAQGLQALEAAWSLNNLTLNELDASAVLARNAGKTFTDYRTSF